jgi:homoserine dehydrogenase
MERGNFMITIGLLGFGTVGTGVYDIITKEKESFKKYIGEEICIKKILVKDLNKKRQISLPKDLLTDNPFELLNDPTIDIIVEAIGGLSPADHYLKQALTHKKHVVTANKTVVASNFKELLYLAEENNKAFLFEASVGGGIPIIKPLKQHSTLNQIKEIKGILNGTTNFILTQMNENNLTFNEALTLAQKLGYAESDPTDDIEGYDVARKLSILSTIAFKKEVLVETIPCRGISFIKPFDIEMFKKIHCNVKLIGRAINTADSILASAEPILIKNSSTLSNVKNAYNLVSLTGNIVGELQFYGEGAGKNPTANAMVCDILDIASGSYKCDTLSYKSINSIDRVNYISGNYYLRFTLNSTEAKERLLTSVEKSDWINKSITLGDNIVFFTKKLSLLDLDEKIKDIKKIAESYLYIKLEEELGTIT